MIFWHVVALLCGFSLHLIDLLNLSVMHACIFFFPPSFGGLIQYFSYIYKKIEVFYIYKKSHVFSKLFSKGSLSFSNK
jgi:hypothetical protein